MKVQERNVYENQGIISILSNLFNNQPINREIRTKPKIIDVTLFAAPAF
ncbi:hypothetical protein GNIT_1588 [Glaciecola nitratireducens FR1064]|uniref:Uncharacterized protein n=1 Tax=Glaciecola nitratireducens (strain JCM 12485 / KCTC 12276 / FR1064) TaxID=1085623 RepID=G4QH74_GLANF|nr:hypothetical protein GNIT_1588 [Glaciecola nitratireducens FR1064]